MSDDPISRQAAIEALWKALFEYEDKTEKQFQESEDLDVGDWIGHRIFVQNMNDIDRQVILNLPSAQQDVPERNVGKWMFYERREPQYDLVGTKTWANAYRCSECGFIHTVIEDFGHYAFCPRCGAEMRKETEDG